jgi:hypothetical protein
MSLQPGSRIRGHHVSSNPRWAPVYFRLCRPTWGASSGDTTCSLYLVLYAIMIHRIVLQFYVCFFVYFSPHVVGCFFSIPLLVRVVQPCRGRACLRYLRPTWVTWLFFYLGSHVADAGSKVCNLLSLVPYPKCADFASLKLSTEY